jgi:hypothetical protein
LCRDEQRRILTSGGIERRESFVRKLLLSFVGASVFAVSFLTGPSAADPAPQACPGELISFAVQVFDGRRAVAATFFGDYPRAVQDAQAFMKQFCGVPGN